MYSFCRANSKLNNYTVNRDEKSDYVRQCIFMRFLLPDKLRISMRKVSERDRDRQVEIQEIFENAQSHLKKAQITTICAMNNKVKFLSERPKSDINDPEISQTSGLHQSCQTAWV